MVDREALLGRRWTAGSRVVPADEAADYAAATCDDPARSVGRGVAPPFYAVRVLAPLWRSMYQLPELGTADQLILHAEQRSLFLREIPLGSRVTAHCTVIDVMSFGFGDGMLVHSVVAAADTGEPLVSMHGTLAIPRSSSGFPANRRRGMVPRRRGRVAQVTCRFDEKTPLRYADAADDHNPLHLDDELARTAGHPGRIVHGLCTLATGVAALSAALPDGGRLRYARARFSRPVLPGQEVVYAAYATGAHHAYALGAAVDGRAALKGAWLRFAPAGAPAGRQ